MEGGLQGACHAREVALTISASFLSSLARHYLWCSGAFSSQGSLSTSHGEGERAFSFTHCFGLWTRHREGHQVKKTVTSGGPKGQRRMRFLPRSWRISGFVFSGGQHNGGQRPRRSGREPKPKVRRHFKGSSSWSALGKSLGGGEMGKWNEMGSTAHGVFLSSLPTRP